jgi:hypothetical protein
MLTFARLFTLLGLSRVELVFNVLVICKFVLTFSIIIHIESEMLLD